MIYNITCEICGKEFEVNCSEYKFNIGKYKHTCSSECAHKLTNKHVDYDTRNKLISSSLKQYNKENSRFKQNKSLKNIHVNIVENNIIEMKVFLKNIVVLHVKENG